jgi:hypothetical protein
MRHFGEICWGIGQCSWSCVQIIGWLTTVLGFQESQTSTAHGCYKSKFMVLPRAGKFGNIQNSFDLGARLFCCWLGLGGSSV